MIDVENIDDFALRISERVRDVINEELMRFFGNMLRAAGARSFTAIEVNPDDMRDGKRRRNAVDWPKDRQPGTGMKPKSPPRAKGTSRPRHKAAKDSNQVSRLIELLKDQPWLSTDLIKELDIPSAAALNVLVYNARKQLKTEGGQKTIYCERGRQGTPSTFALRNIQPKG